LENYSNFSSPKTTNYSLVQCNFAAYLPTHNTGMIQFFQTSSSKIYAIEASAPMSPENIQKLIWLFGEAQPLDAAQINGNFIGPRATMITPWSTNAVEITQNMGIQGIHRIESVKNSTDSIKRFLTLMSNLNQLKV